MRTPPIRRSAAGVGGPDGTAHQTRAPRLLVLLAVTAAVAASLAVLAGCGSSSRGPAQAQAATSETPVSNSASDSKCCGAGHGVVDPVIYNDIPNNTVTLPGATDQDKKAAQQAATAGASLTLLNTDGSNTNVKTCESKTTSAPPQTMGPGSSARYCAKNTSYIATTSKFQYKIGNGDFVLTVYFYTPASFSAEAKCNITTRDKAGKNEAGYIMPSTAKNSVYGCAVWFRLKGGYNPGPAVRVALKPEYTITNSDEAYNLINKYCTGEQGSAQCTYTDSTQKPFSPPESAWGLFGGTFVNCTGDTGGHDVDESYTNSTTNQVGVTVSAGVSKIVSVGVAASYQFAITQSHTVTIRDKMTVYNGREGGFFVGPGKLRVTANWLIAEEKRVNSIKNYTFDLPLKSAVGTIQAVRKAGRVWCLKPGPEGAKPNAPDGWACDVGKVGEVEGIVYHGPGGPSAAPECHGAVRTPRPGSPPPADSKIVTGPTPVS
jgi:hypothetical protein